MQIVVAASFARREPHRKGNVMNRRIAQIVVASLLAAGVVASSPGGTRTPSATVRTAEDPMVYRAVLASANADADADVRSARLCAPGAAWMRLEFARLRLDGDDTLTVSSDRGDRYVFGNGYRSERRFELRSLRGGCVDIEPRFSRPDSAYRIEAYRYASFELTESAVVVAGAGDVCDTVGDGCLRTSDTMLSIAPNAAFVLGDNAYNVGALSEYTERYQPTWGRFKASTKPAPGNHEYATAGASGYFDYFNGVGAQSGIAGERGKGYYSWNIGEWHFVALNSNFAPGGTAEAEQLSWLRTDLAANTQPCTAAYFHHPMVNVGLHSGTTSVKPFWDALYAARADLILVGHDHNYQRYGKMTPTQTPALDGIRQIVVGTGGRALYPITRSHPSLEVSNADSFGVLKLTLTANSYSGEFVPAAGSAFADRFAARCNKATIVDVVKIANCRLPPKRIVPGGSKAIVGPASERRASPRQAGGRPQPARSR